MRRDLISDSRNIIKSCRIRGGRLIHTIPIMAHKVTSENWIFHQMSLLMYRLALPYTIPLVILISGGEPEFN
jgi:hypothetical protein